jgi:hypothetical protein
MGPFVFQVFDLSWVVALVDGQFFREVDKSQSKQVFQRIFILF